jgi:RNA recognition motif-containing protein
MHLFSDFIVSLRRFFTGLFSGGGSTETAGGGHRLYVGNLSYRVKEEELRALFSKVGRVKSLHLIRDGITRRLKGYAFLEMSPADAERALTLNGTDFLDRKIVVSVAKAKKTGPPRQNNPRFRRRRNGPRAYGHEQKENTPIERLE